MQKADYNKKFINYDIFNYLDLCTLFQPSKLLSNLNLLSICIILQFRENTYILINDQNLLKILGKVSRYQSIRMDYTLNLLVEQKIINNLNQTVQK
ncbi:hypothetical protein pb186bvf_006396 [Paramecium bursaria]